MDKKPLKDLHQLPDNSFMLHDRHCWDAVYHSRELGFHLSPLLKAQTPHPEFDQHGCVLKTVLTAAHGCLPLATDPFADQTDRDDLPVLSFL
jgi:hypothetical protein